MPDFPERIGDRQLAEQLGHSTPDVVTSAGNLADQYARGEVPALTALFDQWSAVIFTSAQLAAPATAQQVTIDTFVSLWQRQAQFATGQLSLRGWVRQLSREQLNDDGRAALDRLLLTDELAGFGDPSHRIMELMLTQQLSHLQVATLLGLPTMTVRSELRRSVESLRTVTEPKAGSLRDLGVTHLPPETLALRAFGEQDGLAHEHALDDAHLATCVRCQETLVQLGDVLAIAALIDPTEHLQPTPPQVWLAVSARLHLPLPEPLIADVAQSPTSRRGRSRRH